MSITCHFSNLGCLAEMNARFVWFHRGWLDMLSSSAMFFSFC